MKKSESHALTTAPSVLWLDILAEDSLYRAGFDENALESRTGALSQFFKELGDPEASEGTTYGLWGGSREYLDDIVAAQMLTNQAGIPSMQAAPTGERQSLLGTRAWGWILGGGHLHEAMLVSAYHGTRSLMPMEGGQHEAVAELFRMPLIRDRSLLESALANLNEDVLRAQAEEEGVPVPVRECIENARALLPRLYEIHPAKYHILPSDRGVSIQPAMRYGASVIIECAPDDAVYCSAAIDGNLRRAEFLQMDGLPEGFITEALRDLASG